MGHIAPVRYGRDLVHFEFRRQRHADADHYFQPLPHGQIGLDDVLRPYQEDVADVSAVR